MIGLAPVTSTYSVPPLPHTLILKVKEPAVELGLVDGEGDHVLAVGPEVAGGVGERHPGLGQGLPVHGLVADVGDGDRPGVHAGLQVDGVGRDREGGGQQLHRRLGLLDLGRVARLVEHGSGSSTSGVSPVWSSTSGACSPGPGRAGRRRPRAGWSTSPDAGATAGLHRRAAAGGRARGRAQAGQAEDDAHQGDAGTGDDPPGHGPAGGPAGGHGLRAGDAGLDGGGVGAHGWLLLR